MKRKKYLVYYLIKPKYFDDEEFDGDINILRDYKLVNTVYAIDMDAVYYFMQGEIWSPNGEAKDLIRSLGLSHTSMSIGDVVCDVETGEHFMAVSYGWQRVLDLDYLPNRY